MKNLKLNVETMVKTLFVGMLSMISIQMASAQSKQELTKQFSDLQRQLLQIEENYGKQIDNLGEFKITDDDFKDIDKEFQEIANQEEYSEQGNETDVKISKKEMAEFEKELENISDKDLERMAQEAEQELQISEKEIAEFEKELSQVSDKGLEREMVQDEMKSFAQYFKEVYEGNSLKEILNEMNANQKEYLKSVKNKQERKYLEIAHKMEKERAQTEFKMNTIAKKYLNIQ